MSQSGGPARIKSGYARDVAPELLTAEERSGDVVPPADEFGGQAGRLPPLARKPVHYEVVDAAEAERRMIARRKGELPPIVGGMDDKSMDKQAAASQRPAAPPDQYDDTRMELADAPEVPASGPDAQTIAMVAELLKGLKTPAVAPTPRVRRKTTTAPATDPFVAPDERAAEPATPAYLAKRTRVTLQFKEGMYTIPVVDIKVTPLAVLLVLPYDANGSTFTPNIGTHLTLYHNNETYPSYFPGTSFEVTELKVVLLAFLRKDDTTNSG